jgi:hypothetical protein
MAVVIVWTDDPVSVSEPDAFLSAVKRPAGDVAPDPEFTLYLGTNTGPYKMADNGSVILPPIPIEWIISPQNVTVGQCPSRTDNLQLFGITNVIVLALALVLGCRPLLRYITRGLFGRPSKKSWIWSWIISCGLQVASNAIVSHLVVTTPGYEHLSMVNVFALYSSRPRINQLWMAILRLVVGPIYLRGYLAFLRPTTKVKTPPTQDQGTAVPLKPAALRYQYDEYRNWHSRAEVQEVQITEFENVSEPEWVYTDSYVTTCIAELILHLISAVFIGVTWRRFPNVPIREFMKTDVNLMIAAPALALFSWVCVPIWLRRNKGILEDPNPLICLSLFIFILVIPAVFTYGVAWKYWGDFLQLPGSL